MGKDEFRDRSKNDLIREIIALREELRKILSASGTENNLIVVGKCRRDGKPFVQVESGEARWQMDPATARLKGMVFMDAAVEAERDASVVAFFKSVDFDEDAIVGMLVSIREHRVDWLEGMRNAVDNMFVVEEEDDA